jgi:GNAT superfamily N-acetyltransferase
VVRPREADDLPALGVLMRAVHECDGYPVRWPADPHRFLEPPDALAAWVATDGHSVLGHVLLADPAPDVEVELATGETDAPLALVSRFFVSRATRGLGLGSRLLTTAVADAAQRGRRAALEVLSLNTDAVALYQRSGWVAAGATARPWAPSGIEVLLFLAPVA